MCQEVGLGLVSAMGLTPIVRSSILRGSTTLRTKRSPFKGSFFGIVYNGVDTNYIILL